MKFSIRDRLLLTVIAAILLAWWVDHRRQGGVIEQQKEELKARHFFLTFSDDLNPPSSPAPAPIPPKNQAFSSNSFTATPGPHPPFGLPPRSL